MFKLKELLYTVAGLALPPSAIFNSREADRLTRRRQEHLASLHLPLNDCSVLEVGAGIGEHSQFFIDRGCKVTISEARSKNIQILKRKFPKCSIKQLNLDDPYNQAISEYDIVYCYGVLYHLKNPDIAIRYMAEKCKRLLLLETCVSYGEKLALNSLAEHKYNVSQAVSGVGCRPTRPWVFEEMKKHFPHVYVPKTQPWHEQFPTDWSECDANVHLTRAVFIGSRISLDNPYLQDSLPAEQSR